VITQYPAQQTINPSNIFDKSPFYIKIIITVVIEGATPQEQMSVGFS
jgi:hypothetical protein